MNKYETNLTFYTFLKNIVQFKLTERQLKFLSENIIIIYENKQNNPEWSFEEYKKCITDLLWDEKVKGTGKEKKQKAEDIITIIENEDDVEYICDMVTTAILLFNYKYIIHKKVSEHYSTKLIEVDGIDSLSLWYDKCTIRAPHLQRVSVPLILREVLDTLHEAEDKLSKVCKELIDDLHLKYHVEIESMFDLLVVESINQSITSNAGKSYENRFAEVLKKYSIHYSENAHDDRQSAVEYDFIFTINDFKIGVSAKRTLRERYKQNHRSVNELSVSKMLIVTLGSDLNEAKMNNILELQGQYILVASEVYSKSSYMIECPRVFSSDNIQELFNVLGKRGY